MNLESQFNDRKKVLILGNGFDLDLGRKTLYKDFYETVEANLEKISKGINLL